VRTRERRITELMDGDERIKFALWEENNLAESDRMTTVAELAHQAVIVEMLIHPILEKE
jgi:hypothetical protein